MVIEGDCGLYLHCGRATPLLELWISDRNTATVNRETVRLGLNRSAMKPRDCHRVFNDQTVQLDATLGNQMSRARRSASDLRSVWLAVENCMWSIVDLTTECIQAVLDMIDRCRQHRRLKNEVRLRNEVRLENEVQLQNEISLHPETGESSADQIMNCCDGGDPSPMCATRPMGQPARRFYAVAVGRNPGIYETWNEAAQQVNGFGSNVHRAFAYRHQAEFFMKQNRVDKETDSMRSHY